MEKIVLSEEFKEKVRQAWGHGPKAVLNLAKNEAWNLNVHGEDFDDQINDTGELGIICGQAAAQGVEKFFEEYTVWVNRNYEDE